MSKQFRFRDAYLVAQGHNRVESLPQLHCTSRPTCHTDHVLRGIKCARNLLRKIRVATY